MSANALDNCPFCGATSSELHVYEATSDWDTYSVICACCGAEGPVRADKPKAIEAWNRRADRSVFLEEAARICDETWVSPGDLQSESCYEAAAKIRALASTEQAERNEGEKR